MPRLQARAGGPGSGPDGLGPTMSGTVREQKGPPDGAATLPWSSVGLSYRCRLVCPGARHKICSTAAVNVRIAAEPRHGHCFPGDI